MRKKGLLPLVLGLLLLLMFALAAFVPELFTSFSQKELFTKWLPVSREHLLGTNAIALYFAILKVRPTPFCMLDEIDAALDDRNVGRFAGYLRNLCEKTQFIVITHRRGTMEAADVLYGVTMQEQGVSKILSLDLDEMTRQLGITA